MAPRAAGRSLTTTLFINDNQSWRAAVAPISQLARAVWQATVSLVYHGLLLSEISNAWGVVPPMKCKKWSESRGPLSACALSLERIGWKADGPFKLITEDWRELLLTEHSPAAVRAELQQAAKRQLERALANKVGLAKSEGKRAYVDHVVRLLKPSCKCLDPLEKGVLRSIVCGAV